MKSNIIRRYFLKNDTIIHDCFRTVITNEGVTAVKINQENCDEIILQTGDSFVLGGEFLTEKLQNNKVTFSNQTNDLKVLLEKKYIAI
ncbi:MAG: hypothetical protein MUF58_11810 [Arcicella sp.]|jgi:hypothetical protein|nr:hypothetical protein [Arcicella sp.]